MKLVNYRCETCEKFQEELFNSDEVVPEELEEICPECGGKFKKFNFKKNDQVWHWNL